MRDVVNPKTIVEIPETIEWGNMTYPVVSITGFSTNGKTIESLTIPASVTRLSGTATLTTLKELIIKDSPSELWITNLYSYDGDSDRAEGRHAFYYSPLSELYLGRNLSYYRDNSNGYSPFAKHNFNKVIIGPEVTDLSFNLFWNCNFNSFNLDKAVILKSIRDDALSKTNLEELILPETVESVSNDFRYNQSLRNIYIGKDLSQIDTSFDHFYNLQSITVNPENPNFKSIDGGLYTADTNTLLRWIPAAPVSETTPAKKIADGAFNELQQTTLVIPNGAEELGSNLIRNCSQLSSIVIPASVKKINQNSLSSCYLNNTYESWWFDDDVSYPTISDGCVIVLAEKPPTVGTNAFKGREGWTLWVPQDWYTVDYIFATGWDIFKTVVFGSQLISLRPNILEAGTVSSDKKFYNALERMNLTLESVDSRYRFVGWFDRNELISSEHQAEHKIVSLSSIEARFEPIPDAASDIVSVKIINGHLLVDIDLEATAGTYETTLYDSEGNNLGSVTTQVKLSRSESVNLPNSPDFSTATNYGLIVYDNNNNKIAHYVGKVSSNDQITLIEEIRADSGIADIYYNLQGQRVTSPQKGKIYIVNHNGKYQKVLR